MGAGLVGGALGGSMNRQSTKDTMLASGMTLKKNADIGSPEMRRTSRLGTDPDNLDKLNPSETDPLGLEKTGNLPEIAEAFRKTGNVCMGRTFRILSKNKT